MSEEVRAAQKEERRGRGISGAIILIGLGVVLLLNNLGILEVDWLSLLKYWPVLLILVGLDILLGGRSIAGSLGLAIVTLVVIGGLVMWVGRKEPQRTISGGISAIESRVPLEGIEALDVTLEMGLASEIYLEGLSGSDQAAEVSYSGPDQLAVAVDYDQRGDTGVLVIRQPRPVEKLGDLGSRSIRLELRLTDEVPIDLTVKPEVGRATLDLSGLNLRSLSVVGGASELNIILPEESEDLEIAIEVGVGGLFVKLPGDAEDLYLDRIVINGGMGELEMELPGQGDYEVSLDMGVGSATIRVPSELEARVEFDSGLGSIDVDRRFVQVGEDQWETVDYRSAEDRVLITIDGGVGSVTITD